MSELGEKHRILCMSLVDLMVNYGLLAAVMHQYPDHVREGIGERLDHATQWAIEETEKVQSFGEAYDDE
jgi:hypothetical protein